MGRGPGAQRLYGDQCARRRAAPGAGQRPTAAHRTGHRPGNADGSALADATLRAGDPGFVATVPAAVVIVERVRRIELPYAAWEAAVLPLNYTRESVPRSQRA